ncbi:hypothetical protein HDU76_001610 [Blyttiomyces sp. JEL0837]|nr:hypothetical protein HDU76_001610 [Blyttiomyces sp. JEL0837]
MLDHRDSSAVPISELAVGAADKETGWIAKLPAIPIAAVITLVVLVALASVTGPVGGILGTTSEATTRDLSYIIMDQALDAITNQVQDVLNEAAKQVF